jgi:hypothetical protein
MRLGQPRINSIEPPFLDPYGVSADCAFQYPFIRDAELRANQWSFARARVSIAEDGGTPLFGPQHQYRKPADFLRLIKTKYERRRVEGEFIVTDEASPLDLKYIARVDASAFDPMFTQALACSLALALTEKITTSTSKKQDIKSDYNDIIAEAKKVNAIEAPPTDTPEDTFVLVRR